LQKQIDELIVQLALGKAEVSEHFEAKANFRERLVSATMSRNFRINGACGR